MEKKKYILLTIFIILIIVFAPKITYKIDSILVDRDLRPIFVVKTEIYKDGGTTEYKGLGYQVIKWNIMTMDGTKFGYEIYKSPNYRDVNDGPTKKLKLK